MMGSVSLIYILIYTVPSSLYSVYNTPKENTFLALVTKHRGKSGENYACDDRCSNKGKKLSVRPWNME